MIRQKTRIHAIRDEFRMRYYPLDGGDVIRNASNIKILERPKQQFAGLLEAFRRDAIGGAYQLRRIYCIIIIALQSEQSQKKKENKRTMERTEKRDHIFSPFQREDRTFYSA